MIDTHLHMLYGVDDGAKTWEVALAMARKAVDEGVTEMILTPHYYVPVFESDLIQTTFEGLKEILNREGVDLKLHLGNEIHLNEESILGFEEGKARSLAHSRYLLIELPRQHYLPAHEQMLFDLQLGGNEVIIAHIERFSVFRSDPDYLKSLVDKGFYGQITSKYLIEEKTRKKGFEWIARGCVHVVASDAHNMDGRPPLMKEAYEAVANRFGKVCADTLFTLNPEHIINNEPLIQPEKTMDHQLKRRRR